MRQPYTVGRLLWASLLVYLVGLSALALWAGIRTAAQTDETRRLVTLDDGWTTERYWVVEEETLERKEILTPNAFVRRLHADAVERVAAVAVDLGRRGDDRDRQTVAAIVGANRRYAAASLRMFDAADGHDRRRVDAIHDAIDPTYDSIEHAVLEEGDSYHRRAADSLARLGRTQAVVVWATPIAAVVGLIVLAAFFLVLESYKRRLEAARGERLEQLERAAHSDALTGLGNHRAFQEMFRRLVEHSRGGDAPLKLAIVDIDDFKLVNDRGGHRQGDAVLARLGGLLDAAFGGLAFRTGGDEFAVLLPNVGAGEARERLERLRARAQAELGGPTVSVGIAELPAGALDPDVLFERADAALYEAKHRGRNAVVASAADASAAASARSSSKRSALAQVIEHGAVAVVQQPIWDLRSADVLGYEALLRLTGDVGLTGPGEAFAVAESLGRAHELDALSLRAIAAEAAVAAVELLFVNVSPQSIADGPVADELLGTLLDRLPVGADRLVVELTEHSVTSGPGAIAQLERFARRGVRFALDDTASANAGLEILGSLPMHFIKVDGAVLARAVTEPRMAAVLIGILATAKELTAYVVLEGIENEAILRFAAAIVARAAMSGHVALQGYHLGRPGHGRLALDAQQRYAERIRAAVRSVPVGGGTPLAAVAW